MPFLSNIRTVAKYEARILRRSWFFRLFSIGALFIFTFMNIGLFSPIGDEPWEMVSIPSAVPLINLFLLNIGQAIVVIFLAADFLKRDKKLDTNEVLYTRSMSNLEYVTGKTWGILRLFLSLDLIILAIGLLMNIISKSMKVDLGSYAAYLLIISVPTILFSLGLAFVLMSVIRNQAVTFLLLLGIAAVDMFYMWHRFGSLFDYMAFGTPVFKSAMIGFDNPGFILNQRLLYTFAGLALVLATVLLFRRLPQSKVHTSVTIVLMVIFAVAAGFCGYNTYGFYRSSIETKEMVIETNRKFEERLFPSVTDAGITLSHEDNRISAEARLIIRNDNSKPLDSYLFSINPGLSINTVTSDGKELRSSTTGHVCEIFPASGLLPGASDTLEMTYNGSINESFCYPDYSDNIKENQYRIAMLNVNKRQAFLQKDYVLLTPETFWYPVAGLNYYPSNPARLKIDFTKYTLKIKDEPGLMAVSQGLKKSEEGFSVFSPEKPLTGLTLAIGKYLSDTITVGSVKYINYYYQGHDYYKKDLAEIKDTISHLITGIMRDFETTFSTSYPFTTLSLLEVPVQFYSYPRESTQTRAEVQPSLVLLPEKLATIDNAGFQRRIKRQKKNNQRNNTVVTDKELQFRMFNMFMRNTFMDGETYTFVNGVARNEPIRYRLGPSFYYFKNNFYSSEYPVINAVFESHLQKINAPVQQGPFQDMGGGGDLNDNDKANLMLKNLSFSSLLAKRPKGDTVRLVVTLKGDWLFNMMRSKAGVDEFNKWFSAYLNTHEFRSINLRDFNNDVKSRFGFEFYPYLKDWFTGTRQPGFIFGNLRANEVVVNDRSRYQVTFTASNPEPVAGLFNIAFRTGGPGGRGMGPGAFQAGGPRGGGFAMQGRGMETPDVTRIVFLDSMETRRIGILLESQPRAMTINTLFSRNIPGQITKPVGEIIKSKSGTKPFEGEEILPLEAETDDQNEIIVDNEDPGFNSGTEGAGSPLRRLLGAGTRKDVEYQTIRMFGIPENWQPVVGSLYYGKYILSSVYTRAGKGERSVTWRTPVKKPGYYDVYCYIGKATDRMMVRGPGRAGGGPGGGPGGGRQAEAERPGPGGPGRQAQDVYKDMHYKIFHDEGVDDISVDYQNAEGGWNLLGKFYISSDSAKVVLTNQSEGRIVIGDAVRWARQQ